MPRRKKPVTDSACGTPETKMLIGTTVYIQGGALDAYGRKISAIYAGSGISLVIHHIFNDTCLLMKDEKIICRIHRKYLDKVYKKPDSKIPVVRESRVKLTEDATWWDTNTAISESYKSNEYCIQAYDPVNGKTTIGLGPDSPSLGYVDIKNLKII